MLDADQFIELVENVCLRTWMYTLNGTFGEAAAIFTGIEIAAAASPICGDEHLTLNFFVTSRLLVPNKYSWPGAIRMVAADDAAAINMMRELLVEFAALRKTHSFEAIRDLAQRAVSDYTETEPATVWRRFLAARYAANQAEIESLIMPHPDAAYLWRGNPVPTAVAAQLNSISDSYVVSVVAGSTELGHVTLVTELGRIEAHLVDDSWRIDASPIIAIAKSNA